MREVDKRTPQQARPARNPDIVMWHHQTNAYALPESDVPMWGLYVAALNAFPVSVKTLTNCSVMILAQLVCQRIQDGRFLRDAYHYQELGMTATWGWISAFLFHFYSIWFPTLDWMHHGNVIFQIPLDHLMWRVPIVFAFVIWTRWYHGLLMRTSAQEAWRDCDHRLAMRSIASIQITSLKTWPPIQVVMYMFVPVALRALYHSVAVFWWSVFMAMATRVRSEDWRLSAHTMAEPCGRSESRGGGQMKWWQSFWFFGMVVFAFCIDVRGLHAPKAPKTQVASPSLAQSVIFEAFSRHESMVNNPSLRREALLRYEAARDQCEWRDSARGPGEAGDLDYMWWKSDADLKADYWGDLLSWSVMTSGAASAPSCPVLSAGGWLSSLLSLFARPKPHGPEVYSRFCSISDESGGQYRIRRLGPFVSTGGFDWHRIKVVDPFELRGLTTETYHVTGRFLAPVSPAGQIHGNPPVHIHHANMVPEHGCSANFSRLGEWHGDSQCREGDGGTACYMRTLPAGYGFPMQPDTVLHVDADINDVRHAGAAELSFFLETAIQVTLPASSSSSPLTPVASTSRPPAPPARRLSPSSSRTHGPPSAAPTPESTHRGSDEEARDTKKFVPSKVQEVGILILGTPARFQWWRSTDFAGTYYVPMDRSSAIWCTARMPVAGTIVAGHHYSHQGAFDKAIVFSGISPQDLGLSTPGSPFQLQAPWLPWVPTDLGWADGPLAMTALEQHVMLWFERARATCLAGPCATVPRLAFVLNQTAFEDGVARQMPWPDVAWGFEAGEQFTTLVFHKSMPGHHRAGSEMQQHLALHATYVPQQGQQAQYHHIIPTLDAESAFLDKPNSLMCLAQGGCPAVTWWNATAVMVLLAAVFYGCLTTFLTYRLLRHPVHELLRALWSVGTETTWKERAGRTDDQEGFVVGDLTRTFIRNMDARLRRRPVTASALQLQCCKVKASALHFGVSRSYDPLVNT